MGGFNETLNRRSTNWMLRYTEKLQEYNWGIWYILDFYNYKLAVTRLKQFEDATIPRPINEWHEDKGEVLWFHFQLRNHHIMVRRLTLIGLNITRILRRLLFRKSRMVEAEH